jgi:hypothetical protein
VGFSPPASRGRHAARVNRSAFEQVSDQLLVTALCALFSPACVLGADAVVGINFTHPLTMSLADQDAGLARLEASRVGVIRIGLYVEDKEKGLDFIKRAHARNIRILLTLHSVYPSNVPLRPYRPHEFPGMWQGPPLSYADPDRSGQYFQYVMDKLDAEGIVLAGLELDNEINHPGSNPEFPLPGVGKNFTLDDLYHDPVGQKIAKGYLQYLKVLTVLKQVRDKSKVNQHTPLMPAGLSDTGPEGPWARKFDAAGISATISFWRANGIDKIVDAYAIHTYPWADSPGDKAAAIHRLRRMQQQDLSECHPVGSSSGKPCWITEWGFTNPTRSCPSDEKARSLLIREMMGDFRQLAHERVLTGLIYYTWTGDPVWDVFRCGDLTESGKFAIQPLR